MSERGLDPAPAAEEEGVVDRPRGSADDEVKELVLGGTEALFSLIFSAVRRLLSEVEGGLVLSLVLDPALLAEMVEVTLASSPSGRVILPPLRILFTSVLGAVTEGGWGDSEVIGVALCCICT